MSVENLRALVGYRLAQADEALEAARILLDADSLRASVNRAYYAMFYAILALMAVEREGTSKHAGVISFFNRAFVRTGQFPKDYSRWLQRAFDLRTRCDYSVQMALTRDEVAEILERAVTFVRGIKVSPAFRSIVPSEPDA